MECINTESLIGSNPRIISGLLLELFAELDKQGIAWAVAHGWDGLPYYARHDVDLLVEPRNAKNVRTIIVNATKAMGWTLYADFKFSNLHSYWCMRVDDDCPSYFQIDIFINSGLRGVAFFSTKNALRQRWRNENGIWCAPYSYSAASVLLKEIVAIGKVEREARYKQIIEGIQHEPELFKMLLREAGCGDELILRIFNLCHNKDWDGLSQIAGEIRASVLKFRFSSIPGILAYCVDSARMRIFPFLRLFVAFIGPDGCGKTTIVDRIIKRFDHRPLTALMRIKSNFGNVPRLRELKKIGGMLIGKKIKFAEQPPPGTKGMGMQPPCGRIRAMVYVFYYGIGLALGRIRLLKWRTFSGLIVADRYYYDYYYMHGYINCPKWFKDLVGVIVPKPDLIFSLERPAEEIYAQKPELDIEEIKRQQLEIRRCLKGMTGARIIDASNGVEETVKRVAAEINNWLIHYKQYR